MGMRLDTPRAGERDCAGWCGKKFYSTDKTWIRYCPKCRHIKAKKEANMGAVRAYKKKPIGPGGKNGFELQEISP